MGNTIGRLGPAGGANAPQAEREPQPGAGPARTAREPTAAPAREAPAGLRRRERHGAQDASGTTEAAQAQPATQANEANPAPRRPLALRAVRAALPVGYLAAAYMIKQELTIPSPSTNAQHMSGYVPARPMDGPPDCHPQCLSELVFEGKNENALPVAHMVGDTLHEFRSNVLSAEEQASIPARIPVVYHQPTSRMKAGYLAAVDAGSARMPRPVHVNPGDIAAPGAFGAGRPDDKLRSTLFHEFIHAHTSPKFFETAESFGQDMAKRAGADGAKLTRVVVESLTVGLHAERAPAELRDSQTYGLFSSLARTKLVLPATMHQLGAHVIEQLGADTVRDAVIGGDEAALKKVFDYFEELQTATFAKQI
jgi:hypothetical protein